MRQADARPRVRITRILATSLIALLPAVRAVAAARSPGPASRPNIVFIMADDLGYGDVGAYGQTKIRTPRLDQMAREGTRFTQFYAGSPVCAPSRCTLMTGQHTGHTYIRGNKEHPTGQEPLPDEVTTVGDALKRAGYTTGVFGKWGLGGPDTEGTPMRHGFDEFFGYYDQRRAHFYYPEYLHRNAEKVALPNRVREEPRSPGAGPAVVRGRYSQEAIAEEAFAFLDRHHREPFFLYLPFTIPHAELQAPDDAYAPYVENGHSIFPETPFAEQHYGAQAMPHATYAAMVSRLDRDVGRILDKLSALGLDRNTIVFFTSDNGPSVEGGSDPEFFDSNGPFRGAKRDVYEGGIRVPMIVWGPGRIAAARTSDQVWALWDVLPTLSELADAKAPAGIDGISMVPSLTGRGRQRQHDSLYWEFYEQGSKQAARMGRWKGVRQPMRTGKLEVYDLQTDPGETHDVSTGHRRVAARLARLMDEAHTPSMLWRAPDEPPTR
jgi:arylsulfatase A-like enzyme